ncbi:MAG: enoyl-CoA hydratase/isomerase family protein [Actinomycetota bacterium]|nr:enoyl-CoA hydratase/isomerase family protein [Actinomycetota bacterium]
MGTLWLRPAVGVGPDGDDLGGATTTMQAVHVGTQELRDLIDDPGVRLPGGDGPCVLVVDVEPAARAALAGRSLAGLRAVVVARSDHLAEQPSWCDLVLGTDHDDELASVVDTVARHPHAASTLVELLRVSDDMTVEAGLLAESASYGVLQAGTEFARWHQERREHQERRATRRPTRAPHDGPLRDGPLLVRRIDDVLHLTLHRPERRNALDVSMRDALVEQLHLVQLDPTITAVVLDGQGPDFCSGGDLDEFGTAPDASLAHLIRLERSIGRSLAAVADRLTVRLHGACIGSGIELAAFASTVRADGGVSIGLPEVEMGLIPGAGGTVSLTRRIGRHRTCRLALSRIRIDAATAHEWGLVDVLDPPTGPI